MQIERIIMRTRNTDNLSQLVDRMISEETLDILGVEYKVVSAGIGIEVEKKREHWDTRVFELEGVIE